ncbi:hypothetical protein MRB53_030726 [Persea americana]|uniref:Uncharacterized protein n=1 Tax=Persea americana TaxID=3435 RepID=A0ACC2KM65_PERAE|nr:hypothetical protein MRB53_030726 [Persea americana]
MGTGDGSSSSSSSVSDDRPALKQSSDPLGLFFVFLDGFNFRTRNLFVSRRDFFELIIDLIEKNSREEIL